MLLRRLTCRRYMGGMQNTTRPSMVAMELMRVTRDNHDAMNMVKRCPHRLHQGS